MYQVMVAGAGKIGSLIACLLTDSKDYKVHLADQHFDGPDVQHLLHALPKIKTSKLDVRQEEATLQYLKKNKIRAVISCLPFFLNSSLARAAKAADCHYFDLTEDTKVTEEIKVIAMHAKGLFVPQCGLAPGFVGIVANNLMQSFEHCEHAKLRVGALPERVSNALHYSLTWSTDGLINEYGNLCVAIEAGKLVFLKPLEDLESIELDACPYEAFNTSGGLGSLSSLYLGKIQTLNYKTLRYPGHCEKIRFLMNDLKLNEDRPTLKRILEEAIPKTYQDVVIVYISVEGRVEGLFEERSYLKKLYPIKILDIEWSAIQAATASGVCAVVDVLLHKKNLPSGFFIQERLDLHEILKNRFGQYFQENYGHFKKIKP